MNNTLLKSGLLSKDALLPGSCFLKNVFLFALPIALQNMSAGLLSILDIVIIGKMGENAVATVSMANQMTYITNLITFGISSGGSIFLARGFGAGDESEVRKNFSMILFLSVAVNSVITAFSMISPKTAMGIFTDKQEIVLSGVAYLSVAAPSFVIAAVSQSFSAFFRSAKNPDMP